MYDTDPTVAERWDAEYRSGRTAREPPDDFVADLLSMARVHGVRRGLYVGCGNGRNFEPLVDGGLDLEGLDVSAEAIRQLTERRPEWAGRVRVTDLAGLPEGALYPLVIGIQVFQHGDRAACRVHLLAAQARVAEGGLFGLRVNAAGTEYAQAHDVVERDDDGSESIRYRAGPKEGLTIHFFARSELEHLFEAEFSPVLPLRRSVTVRRAPERGHWDQWEGIWQRRRRPTPAVR